MKTTKQCLEVFFLTLKGTEDVLNLAESRVRDAFMKKVATELDTFYADRKKIYEKFCDKDEQGKPIITDDKYTFLNANMEELNKELQTLADEEVEIPTDKSEEIKSFIEKTEYKPRIGQSELIDKILGKM